MRRERGLVLIIAYKLVKACLWLVFAAVILVTSRMGLDDRLLGVAEHFRQHAAHAWSVELAELVVKASSRRGLVTIAVALLADGTLTLVEGVALLQGRWWAPWLVVVATGSLLPFELVALFRHPRVLRLVIVIVNVAVVVYLARKAGREHRLRRLERRERESSVPPRGALPPA